MTSSTPLISVALITYNHEKYIAESIRSVLGQTVADLELVIVDDGSTDRTPEIIRTFNDPRIVSIRQENQGPSGACNRVIAACRGRYIALLSGDDVCHPDRLEAQLNEHHRVGGGLVLSNMDYIDDDSKPIESCHMPKDYCLHPQMSRAQILRRFFSDGNFAAIATAFADAESFKSMAPFDLTLYQAQDYEWLIRFAARDEFTFMPRCTVHYRAQSNNTNLSAPSPTKVLRTHNEIFLIFRRFFNDIPLELFREAFRDQLICPESTSPLAAQCEQAFLLLRHPRFPLVTLIGLEKLHGLLNNPEAAEILRTGFRFTHIQFAERMLEIDARNDLARFQTRIFFDDGDGYKGANCVQIIGNHQAERFKLSFDLPSQPSIRELCWKIVEFQLCRCRVEQVCWFDETGRQREISPEQIGSNGERDNDGCFNFDHLDPTLFFPIVGKIKRLTVQGRWWVEEPFPSLYRTNLRFVEKSELIKQQARELTELREQARELRQQEQRLREILNSRSYRAIKAIKSVARLGNRRRAG